MGAKRIELTGFRDTEVEQLKSFGFFSEIISWRLRLFLPLEPTTGIDALSNGSSCFIRRSPAAPRRRSATLQQQRRQSHDHESPHPNFRTASPVNAEAVCRAYLPNGRRHGRYWICGDVHGRTRPQPVRQALGRTGGPLERRRDRASMATCSISSASTKDFRACRDTLAEARRILARARAHPAPFQDRRLEPPHDPVAAAAKLYRPVAPRARHARRDLFARTRHHRAP